MAAVFVLALAGVGWAEPPAALSTDPGSTDPIPRCILDSGATEGDELSVLRTGCDVLAFTLGYAHGFIRPCGVGEDCSADANGDACLVDETLWLCMGVGTAPE